MQGSGACAALDSTEPAASRTMSMHFLRSFWARPRRSHQGFRGGETSTDSQLHIDFGIVAFGRSGDLPGRWLDVIRPVWFEMLKKRKRLPPLLLEDTQSELLAKAE
jgi:hypothetical protein